MSLPTPNLPCSALWSNDLAERNQIWGNLAGVLGVSFAPLLVRPTLIVVRGGELGKPLSHGLRHVPAYDDTGALLAHGKDVEVFRMASHAYQANSTESPDVANTKGEAKKDGVGDVGSILPGKYLAHLGLVKPYPIFTMTTPEGNAFLPCVRDVNHDTSVTEEELAASVARGDKASAVLIHLGYTAPADSAHRWSIACLTMDLAPLTLLCAAASSSKDRIVDCFIVNIQEVVGIESKREKVQAGDGIA